MFCIIAYLFLLFHIIYGIFKRRKEKRKYNKAFDKYYEEMKSISLDSNTLSEEEIADRLEYDTKKRPKPNELRIITQLLTEIKSLYLWSFGTELKFAFKETCDLEYGLNRLIV